jgi:hypothetical protein
MVEESKVGNQGSAIVPLDLRNLDWLRKLSIQGAPDFSARMSEVFSDLSRDVNTMEQQTNSNMQGTPDPPPAIDNLQVVPHPQGVQYRIVHNGDFYQSPQYEIDCSSKGVTHTYDVGTSRNGVLPVGNLTANYQVRARYPNGQSTSASVLRGSVIGGTGSSDLLPSEGAGTTKRGQPPGFGGPYRGSKPPVRTK